MTKLKYENYVNVLLKKQHLKYNKKKKKAKGRKEEKRERKEKIEENNSKFMR